MRKSMIFGYARVSTKTQNLERQMQKITSKIKRIAKDAYFQDNPDGTEKGFEEHLKLRTKIFSEKFTGTKIDRPEWNKLCSKLQSGDTVIFDEVSRMSRNAEDGFEAYKTLYEKGVNLIFIQDPSMNTSHFRKTIEIEIEKTGNWIADKYIKTTNEVLMELAELQFKAAFEMSEKDIKYLRQRTTEGMKASGATSKYKTDDNGEVILDKYGRPVIDRDDPENLGKISKAKTGKKLNVSKAAPMKEQIRRRSKDFDGTETDAQILQNIGLARNTYYKYKKELKKALNSEES